jgi:hypothetical protein
MAFRAAVEFACVARVAGAATPHRGHCGDAVADCDAGDTRAGGDDAPGRLMPDGDRRDDDVLIVLDV